MRTYSLGMRQRLGLAGALLGDPELLLLDEPANGLDPAGVHWLRGFLRQFADQGRTVLISSHVLAEVAQTVDQVLIIDNGRLIGRCDSINSPTAHNRWRQLYLELTAKGPNEGGGPLGAAQARTTPTILRCRSGWSASSPSSCCCTSSASTLRHSAVTTDS